MTELEQTLLTENRQLRVELDALRTGRRPIDATTLIVSECELPGYIPYAKRDIVKLRRDGRLRATPDLRKGGKRWLYNLHEVKATLLAGKPAAAKGLIQFDMARLRSAEGFVVSQSAA